MISEICFSSGYDSGREEQRHNPDRTKQREIAWDLQDSQCKFSPKGNMTIAKLYNVFSYFGLEYG